MPARSEEGHGQPDFEREPTAELHERVYEGRHGHYLIVAYERGHPEEIFRCLRSEFTNMDPRTHPIEKVTLLNSARGSVLLIHTIPLTWQGLTTLKWFLKNAHGHVFGELLLLQEYCVVEE